MKTIKIFDTTLRDGEQTPGTKLNTMQKCELANVLESLGVDVIEAGFPVSSEGDFQSVKAVSKQVKNCEVAGLARANKNDIDVLWKAIKEAVNPRIHIVLGSSSIHMEDKLRKTPDECIELASDSVRYAKKYCSNIEYSLEDASRSDFSYIKRLIHKVISAGATTINVPDTVGYALPNEFGDLIKSIKSEIPDYIHLSVHCHNDLGLATANTIAGIQGGADQVEVTINGIGERAGNAALEEVVAAIEVKRNLLGVQNGIDMSQLYKTSKKVSKMMQIPVQVNKAVVGENAFSHSSGIHQDGILKNRKTYEVLSPELVGALDHEIVLTARSGRHAFKHQCEKNGIEINSHYFETEYQKFLSHADAVKRVSNQDLIDLFCNVKTI